MSYTILLYICWAVVGLVWLMGALYNMLHSPATAKRGVGALIPALVVLGVMIANHFWGPASLWISLMVRSHGLAAALAGTGSAALLAGTIFTLWARLVLGTMWSSAPVARMDHALKTSGPYAVTRNPIYTGLLTMFAGTVMIKGLGIWVLYLAVGIIYFEIKIQLEECLLTDTFGETYIRYRRQVPQLVPGINLLRRGQHARG